MLDKLIEKFLKFPGVGPRQAKRFALFLANENSQFSADLANLILQTKKNILQCPLCLRFHENSVNPECAICSSLNRDKALLMIVERDVDLDNIEKSGVYNGQYFVVGGVLSLTGGKQNNLKFNALFDRVQKTKPGEVILAFSATAEGENTARYTEKILEPLGIRITRLGRGLSTGTEMEYIDSETMSNAMENRK